MSFRVFLIAVSSLLAIVVVSCGGSDHLASNSAATTHDQVIVPVEIAGALPSLDELKGASWEVSESQYGTETYSRGGDAVGDPVDIDELTLTSGAQQLSWGIWQYSSSDPVTEVEVTFLEETGNEIWFAAADFTRDSWEFFGPFTADFVQALDAARHMSEVGSTYVAAIAYDGQGAVIEELRFFGEHQNIAPVADIQADKTMGYTPMYVVFNASGSTDEDGTVVRYDWDFDGDDVIDASGGSATASYTYTEVGTYEAKVTVTDNRDPLSDSATISIEVGPNDGPVAVLTATPLIGDAPLSVDLDGSGSNDPDGSIVDYEWDFNGNGVFNEAGAEEDHRGSATATGQEYAAGLWYPRLRVTDDKGSYGYVTSDEIRVHGWVTKTLASNNAANSCSIALIAGMPQIAFYGTSSGGLRFTRSGDNDGYGWSGPSQLASGAINSPSILSIDNAPAIAYYSYSSSSIAFTRATDFEATSWGAPVTFASGSGATDVEMAIVDGNPAVMYYSSSFGDYVYIRALDAFGTSWGAPVAIAPTAANGACALVVADGNPAVAYFVSESDDIYYIRANDSTGATWGSAVLIGPPNTAGAYVSMAILGGNPAISYRSSSSILAFVRATDAQGTAWGGPYAVDAEAGTGVDPSLAVIDGKAAIAYRSLASWDLRYVEATDLAGTSWGTPVTLEPGGKTGTSASLVELSGGFPGIAHLDADIPGRLLFTRLY